jgi:hypothetical protein
VVCIYGIDYFSSSLHLKEVSLFKISGLGLENAACCTSYKNYSLYPHKTSMVFPNLLGYYYCNFSFPYFIFMLFSISSYSTLVDPALLCQLFTLSLLSPDYFLLLVNFFNELRFPLLKSSYHYIIVNFLLMLLPSRFLFPYFSINFSIQNTNLYFTHLILYSLFTNHQAVCHVFILQVLLLTNLLHLLVPFTLINFSFSLNLFRCFSPIFLT